MKRKRNEELNEPNFNPEIQFIECFSDGTYSRMLLQQKHSEKAIACWKIQFKPFEEIKHLLLSAKEKELKKEEQRIRLIVAHWRKIHPEYFPLETNRLIKMGFAYNSIKNAWKYEWEEVPGNKE